MLLNGLTKLINEYKEVKLNMATHTYTAMSSSFFGLNLPFMSAGSQVTMCCLLCCGKTIKV